MSQHLGRELLESEVVHHINHDKLDNRIENLEVMDRIEHSRMHSKEWIGTADEKVCTRCHRLKPIGQFALKAIGKSGQKKYRSFCNICEKLRQSAIRKRRMLKPRP